MSTGRASPGRVARVYRQHQDALALRLVGDERAQLKERPSFEPTALGLPSRYPVPYSCQIFAGDSRRGVFGLRNEAVTHSVVLVRSHPRLSHADFLQFPLGTFGARLLAGPPHTPVAFPYSLNGITAEIFAVIRRGQVLHAQVSADDAMRFFRLWGCAGQHNMDKEGAVSPLHQCGTGRQSPVQGALLVGAQLRGKMGSVVQQRQTERPVPFPETEEAGIVVSRGGLKGRVHFCRDFERRTHPRYCAYRQVRGQTELLPDVLVGGMLELHLVGGMDRTRYFCRKGIRLRRDTVWYQPLHAIASCRFRGRGTSLMCAHTVSKRSGKSRRKNRDAGVVPSAVRQSKLCRTVQTL